MEFNQLKYSMQSDLYKIQIELSQASDNPDAPNIPPNPDDLFAFANMITGKTDGDYFSPSGTASTSGEQKTGEEQPSVNNAQQNKDITAMVATNTREYKRLKRTLENFARSIDSPEARGHYGRYYRENKQTITKNELTNNLKRMSRSYNRETSGIARTMLDVYNALGINTKSKPSYFRKTQKDVQNDTYKDIVTNAIFRAIKGEEIDPLTATDETANYGQQTGITVDDLLALDKDGDGSVVKELQELLCNPEFLGTCQLMIERADNKVENQRDIYALDMFGNRDGSISANELQSAFGYNQIADIFRKDDGTVDRAMMMALGGSISKDGDCTIDIAKLEESLYELDIDRDGNISAEEIENYKQGYEYKGIAFNLAMSDPSVSFIEKMMMSFDFLFLSLTTRLFSNY